MIPKNLLLAAATFVAASSLSAAVVNKAATGTDLTDGASWAGTAPGSSDVATWSGSSLGGALTLGTAQSWQGIDVQGATGAIIIGAAAGPVLSLGSSGINIGASGQNLTIATGVALTADQSWSVASGKALALSGGVTGTNNVSLSGAGTLTLGASSAFTLNLASGSTVTLRGSGSASTVIAANITAASGVAINLGDSNFSKFTGILAGDSGLNANGSTTLAGTNTFTGAVNIAGGFVCITSDAALGAASNTINLNGGILSTYQASGTVTLNANRGIVLNGGSLDLAQALVINGIVSGSGQLKMNTSGSLTLNGANNFSGGTTLSGGTTTAGNSSAFGSAAIAITGNATIVNNAGFTNAISIASGKTLTLGSNNYNSVSGVISGQGGLTVNNNVTLTGNNTFTGNFTVTGGYVTVTKDAAFGAGTNTISYTGGNISSFNAGAAVNLTRNITITNIIGLDSNGQNLTLSGVISGTGGLNKLSGGNLLSLAGVNTYTGKTTVNSGTLTIASTGAINVSAAAGGVTIASGKTLAVDGKLVMTSAAFLGAIANSGTLALNVSSSVLDLNGLFDGQAIGSTYQLLSGTGSTTGNFKSIIGYTPGTVTFNNANGLLTFNAVPEPSTYGLLGAGALAAAAMVRRRRKTAASAA